MAISLQSQSVLAPLDDGMVEAVKPGKPYQTRLDPPPDAEGNFPPLPQWLPGEPQPADWPTHIHAPIEVYDWAKEQGIDWHTLLEPNDVEHNGHENSFTAKGGSLDGV